MSTPGTFVNTNTIVVNGGSNQLSSPVEFVNNGVVEVINNGTETITTPLIGGTGSMEIGSGGDLVLNAGAIEPTQSIIFTDATGLLTIGTIALGGFNAVISGFRAGDHITVQTTKAATFQQNGSVISIIADGLTLGDLEFASTAQASLAMTASGLDNQVLCFCAGTYIATPSGEMPVERLAAGDKVLTRQGEAREITWVGAGRVLATRGRRSAATPVIIRKAALADNVPHQDLRVTKGHSFLFDDVLIPIEFLVNHHSILWDDRAQEVELYHIELESHDVLLANGAAAESYRDDGNRWLFQNANSAWQQTPQMPCAPVLTDGPIVDAVWRRLMERAGQPKTLPLTDDPDLHLLVDGRRVDPINTGEDMSAFRLTARPRSVRICSRSAVPQELGIARDSRELGVAVRRLVLAAADREIALEADSAALSDGFHPFEQSNGIRWTNGDAAVPDALLADLDGPCLLMVHVAGTTQYVDTGVRVSAPKDLPVRFARRLAPARSA